MKKNDLEQFHQKEKSNSGPSRVVRIKEATIDRLSKHVQSPFKDTPDKVINRMIDFYEHRKGYVR